MGRGTDGPARTSEQRLSELAGIQASLRQDWAKRGRLRRRGRDGYEEIDAIELVVLKAVMDVLGASDGPIAWAAIREDLPQRVEDAELVLAFDTQDKAAWLASSLEELRSRVVVTHVTVLVDIGTPLGRGRAAFARITSGV